MGVYIKDMEMPKNDTFQLTLLDDGTVCDGEWGYVVAQAVELPPHGRLIDADAFLASLAHNLGIRSLDYLTQQESAIVSWIKTAPTIIEAEGAK